MQSAVQIDFQDVGINAATRALIESHVAALEERCDRITGCRAKFEQHEGQPVGPVTKLDALGEFGIIERLDGIER